SEIDANTRRDIREKLRKEITETSPEPLFMAGQQAIAALQLVQITRQAAAPQNPTVAALKREHPDQILDVNDFRGDLCITIKPEHSLDICRTLKQHPALKFDMLSTITGLDYLGHPGKENEARFNVVYHLYSVDTGNRVRLKVPVPEPTLEIES